MKTTTKPIGSVTKYIAGAPKETQVSLRKIRQLVKELIPKAEEGIAYGMPTFKLNGKNLVHFAGWKTHIGFYPTPSPIQEFEKDLAKYKVSKGAIQFPLDKPLPLMLIKKMVKSKMRDLLSKSPKK